MATLVPTITSTISLLSLLPKSSPHHRKVINSFKLLHPQHYPSPPFCTRFPFKSMSSSKFHSHNAIPPAGGNELVVLGIETSCDDTAAAVVRSNGEILSQVVSSQILNKCPGAPSTQRETQKLVLLGEVIDLLARYGGVAPKMAEEAHSQVIDQVVQEALDKANLSEMDLSAVAVTIGPGLSLCLRVGVQKARKIAARYKLPMVGVHHMEAHALVAR